MLLMYVAILRNASPIKVRNRRPLKDGLGQIVDEIYEGSCAKVRERDEKEVAYAIPSLRR